jgi:cytidine deaminase
MKKLSDLQKKQLMDAATAALKNPYPKDAPTVYAAAVLTKQGNIYSAAQYFSDTYSLTLHGEQSALAHAAAHRESEIAAIAITSNEQIEGLTYPCHMCKQLLWESSRRSKLPMTLIVFNQQGQIEEIPLEKMISYPWPK